MKRLLLVCLLVGGPAMPAHAWWLEGHHILTLAAVGALPDEVPAFFRNGAPMIAHVAIDPDLAKDKETPHVRAAEYPEHYMDRELLKVDTLPDNRYAFIKLCCEQGVAPDKMGFLPYALDEWTERLAIAFAEYRKWPKNPYIQNKCLVYAGFISHYAEDMCQPLHLTVNYDGLVQPDGTKLQKGIHAKVDGVIEILGLKPKNLSANQEIVPLDDLMGGILAEMQRNYTLINRVYELGPQFPKEGEKDWKRDDRVVAFANERGREATRFTAQMYLTAWRLSASLTGNLKDDLDQRPKWDGR